MDPVTTRCGGCGVRVRLARPELAIGRGCPRCGFSLESSLRDPSRPEPLVLVAGPQVAAPTPSSSGSLAGVTRRGWPTPALVLVGLGVLLVSGFYLVAGRDSVDASRVVGGGDTPDRHVRLAKRPPEIRPERECPAGLHEPPADAPEPAPELPGDAGPSHREGGEALAEGAAVAEYREASPGPEAGAAAGSESLSLSSAAAPSEALDRNRDPAVRDAGQMLRLAQAEPASSPMRRILVQTAAGRMVVARVHGAYGDQVSALLPDGQLGFPRVPVYTEDPFEPATQEEMIRDLLAGPFAGFRAQQSTHYVVLFQSTASFAEASLKLLEELYQGLTRAFRERDIPVHEPEFPLVAIIFRNERDFRAHKKVDPEVQAYYEIFTNRIYFYQTSERDEKSPEITALRKPQTVAHEGTHQILQNVGVHPRLGAWPLWLVEGLAEYCASGVSTKKGVTWKGLGAVNPIHMATIRDLEDPLSMQVAGRNQPRIGRDPRMPLIEYLVTRTELTPTDYALAWALTHYLALKKGPQFVDFLRAMSQIPPLKQVTPDEHLATFRAAFGNDLAKMDRAVGSFLSKLKGYDQLPYYAVMFEQRIGPGMLKRAAIVSQSPSMIRQWLETISAAEGDPPSWKFLPYPTRARALLTAEQWMRNQ